MTSFQEGTDRRSFIKAAGAGGIGLCVATGAAPAVGAVGANDKIRLGFIGCGGRGSHHMRVCGERDDVEFVAVADVDGRHRDAAVARLRDKGAKVEGYKDFRRILDRKDIDAVFVATPGHWHVIPTLMACEAGKDVFVEKPLGHNVREGRLVIEGAEKHKRVVAIGTQQRSGPTWMEAIERIHAGELGQISLVRSWNSWWVETPMNKTFADLAKQPSGEAPDGVDYDFWLGPAPKREFDPQRFHFGFYYFWDYSGGMMSAWAVHLFDVVLWAMGYKIKSVVTEGGLLVCHDGRETPDTAQTIFDCGDHLLTYEMRHANGQAIQGDMDHGIEFHGTKATLQINRSRYVFIPREGETETVKDRGMDEFHVGNFFDCVRSRKQPNANPETGHQSAIYGHLANISYRVGRKITWNAQRETIPGDPEAAKLLRRDYRKPWVL